MSVVPLFQRYRSWESRQLELLDALEAGRVPPDGWEATRHRRNVLTACRAMTPAERRALRAFIWRGRGWRIWAVIAGLAAASTAVGLVLHLASPAKWGLLQAVLFANSVAFGIGFVLVAAWFNSRVLRFGNALWWKGLLLGLVGVLAGLVVRAVLEGRSLGDVMLRTAPQVASDALPVLVALFAVVAAVVVLRNRELDAENARLAAEAERTRLAHELNASRLRLVQAQIEPHFLFNTLGSVQQLAQRSAPDAAALTAHLIRFLRGAMTGLRAERSTLAAEFEMVEAYLGVMQVRLGRRLAYALELPEELRAAPMLPTILITLVENAIKHGIEPAPDGGRIDVRARLEPSGAAGDATLVVEVVDSGAGMPALPGNGHGLASVRDQLALAYDGGATLELLDHEPRGVVAAARLPWPAMTP